MLHYTNELMGYAIRAIDGDLGRVDTLLFDDERWIIRYVVVDTGIWLPGREVLISPFSIRNANWANRVLEVSLTRDAIERSPDIETTPPVSRQQEARHAVYYGYPAYWAGPGLWGPADHPAPTPRAAAEAAAIDAERVPSSEDSHLRSIAGVTGYHIQATDGEIGHVEDLVVEQETWAIRYLLADTSNWWIGRRVLVAPAWISGVSWVDATVSVQMTREAVKNSPELISARHVSRQYEENLHAYYQRAGYWTPAATAGGLSADASANQRFARLDEVNDLEVADYDHDVRGWHVVAADRTTIGKVEHLIVDRLAMKVRYLEVGLDENALGLCDHRDILVPLADVDLNEASKEVQIPRASSHVLAQLPQFHAMPVGAEYDELFRSRTEAAAPSVSPRDVHLRRQTRT